MEQKTKPGKLAVIRIRGEVNRNSEIKDTLDMLNLHKSNWCVVLNNNPSYSGMLKKVKDYVTWGDITDELYKEMVEKKGEPYLDRTEDSKGKIKYNRFIEIDGKKYKRYFRMDPPKGGFEKGGIKTPFNRGGVLGYRGDKIQDLIKKML